MVAEESGDVRREDPRTVSVSMTCSQREGQGTLITGDSPGMQKVHSPGMQKVVNSKVLQIGLGLVKDGTSSKMVGLGSQPQRC